MQQPDAYTARLIDWLRVATNTSGEPTITPMAGGGSCEMFHCDVGQQRFVIRRAPLATVAESAHDVLREFCIIEALGNSIARVPDVIAACDDSSLLGAPFYLMRYIDGAVIRRGLPELYLADPTAQPLLGEELIDALVELHGVPWRGTALESVSSPDNFLQRQVGRWSKQLASYQCRELAGIDRLASWLQSNRPANGELTVMHGDYKIDNVMFSLQMPPRILALLDFEMTTIGDPLIDLAWCMIFWPETDNPIAIAAPGSERGMSAAHCQSPQVLIDRYAEKTGRDTQYFRWYEVFAAWKLAIVLEGSYAKYLSGESKNTHHEFFGFVVDRLLERAQRLVE